ncbi:MAG: hypothetical protein J6W86_08970 [Bacteroidales bacterium]|nr:hypothetical protein [Bacteroidales bacterium]
MIKIILLSLALLLLPSATQSKPVYVYVCLSTKSYAYHIDRSCRFLNQCKAKIKKVTLEEAVEWGRKPCKGCTK